MVYATLNQSELCGSFEFKNISKVGWQFECLVNEYVCEFLTKGSIRWFGLFYMSKSYSDIYIAKNNNKKGFLIHKLR